MKREEHRRDERRDEDAGRPGKMMPDKGDRVRDLPSGATGTPAPKRAKVPAGHGPGE